MEVKNIMETQDFKRTIEFIDSDKSLAKVDIEIQYKNRCRRLSMSGQYHNGGGQCTGHINPANDNQKALLILWDKYHLNDINAGTATQAKALEKAKSKGIDVSDYDKACKYLKKIKLYAVQHRGKAYTYGSSWLVRPLPKNIVEMVNTVCDNIEVDNKQRIESIKKYYCVKCNEVIESNILIKINKCPINKCPECGKSSLIAIEDWEDIERIEKEGVSVFDDDKIIALGQYLDITPSEALEDIEQSSKYNNEVYTYAGQDYLICDDDEADEAANDYLTDDPELWKMAVQAGNTTDSLEDWADNVIRNDGRGSVLNSYDGEEGEEQVNGTYYFIYRR